MSPSPNPLYIIGHPAHTARSPLIHQENSSIIEIQAKTNARQDWYRQLSYFGSQSKGRINLRVKHTTKKTIVQRKPQIWGGEVVRGTPEWPSSLPHSPFLKELLTDFLPNRINFLWPRGSGRKGSSSIGHLSKARKGKGCPKACSFIPFPFHQIPPSRPRTFLSCNALTSRSK